MRPRLVVRSVLASVAVCLLAAPPAYGQASGIALSPFNPSERGSQWFAEDSLDLRGNLRPAFGVVADYADRPLIITNASGKEVAAPVETQVTLHVGGSIVFVDRFRFGLDLPLGFAGGTAGQIGTSVYPAAESGLGDFRISADARLVGVRGDPFTLALGASLFLPSGSQAAYMSDGSVRGIPRIAVAGDLGHVTYAAHLGFEARASSNDFPGYPLGSSVEVGGAVGARLLSGRFVVGPEVDASTVVTNGSAVFSARQTPVEGLLGAHFRFTESWQVGAGVGTGLTRGFGEPPVRALAMIEWASPYMRPPADRDKDGVLDDVDACPDVPGIATDDPKTNGCPPTDRDKDGIIDPEDACPDVPGPRSDDRRMNGCPPDRDHDGIPDSEDQCPDTPGVRMDDKAHNGCAPDSDKDGIPDADDACPGVPGVRTNDPKTNGCPDLDRDQDGIPNEEDACPDVKGPRDQDPKRNGCPAAYLQDDQIHLLDRIHFVGRGAALAGDAETSAALAALLSFLDHHPEIKQVRVEGHTDNQGDPTAQHALSARRAAAVIAWLAQQHVDADRLTPMGVGGDSPIEDNSSEAGRKANERIEIHVE
jgi:outer membrane protein OmpA-like peptidoglycan-associated protein